MPVRLFHSKCISWFALAAGSHWGKLTCLCRYQCGNPACMEWEDMVRLDIAGRSIQEIQCENDWIRFLIALLSMAVQINARALFPPC